MTSITSVGTLKLRFAYKDLCGFAFWRYVWRRKRWKTTALLRSAASFSKHGKPPQGLYKKEVGFDRDTQITFQ